MNELGKEQKQLTLSDLLAQKQAQEDAPEQIKIYVPQLGGYLIADKVPVSRIADLLDSSGSTTMKENLAFSCALISMCCPLFRSQELLQAYHVAEPPEVVIKVFGENVGTLNAVSAKILDNYGMANADELKALLKN